MIKEEIESASIKYTDSLVPSIDKFSDQTAYSWSQVSDAYEAGANLLLEENQNLEEENKLLQRMIDKYKDDLKKLRIAFIQSEVTNVMNGTSSTDIIKEFLNHEKM